jgi:signal transduction histidine kinase
MSWFFAITNWLAGNGRYCTLSQCMNYDTLWITLTVSLDLLIAAGYAVITYHWWSNQRALPPSPARSALATMRNIFLFCCICGYIFIPVKMFWPAWRLYDMFLAVLAFFTWRYAWNTKNLKVIYSAVGRSNQLMEDLEASREESKRKSFFLNAVSHDLRTPLNGLLLHANLAELHAENNETAAVREALGEIKSCVRMTAELLDGLLEYARLENAGDRLNKEDIDLDQLLRDLLNTHAAMGAKKGLEINGDVNTGLTVRTDRLKLERILNNLLSNAVKFTQAGSVRVEVSRAHENVQIHVIDTGVGISAEDRARLFEEFFQVHNHERDRQKGFGLGLAISRRLARQLGGELEVHSSLGNGSRFTVVLPNVIPSPRSQAVTGHAGTGSVDFAHSAASVARGG